MNTNEMKDDYSVEELEARFEMEAIIDDGGSEPDGRCECVIEW